MVFLIKKIFAIAALIYFGYDKAEVEVAYDSNGVVRKDGNGCDITFTNFGIEDKIKNISVEKTQIDDDTFNLKIGKLVNGNMGPIQTTYTDKIKLAKAIEITQNGNTINKKVVTDVSNDGSTLTLRVDELKTCSGLVIKQTFIEPHVKVATRLLHSHEIPSTTINTNFPLANFGPSYNSNFGRIYWKINEGLDALREGCGIYIHFTSVSSSNTPHWQYYLSTENVNTKQCTHQQFFEILKNNYEDYSPTKNLFGDDYIGYVLKREGHPEEHMDGAIVSDKNNYHIQVYQKECHKTTEFKYTDACIIPSENNLTFNEFTNTLLTNCFNINNPTEDEVTWSISNGVATTELSNQILKISVPSVSGDKAGSLPSKVDGKINYKSLTSSGGLSLNSIANFVVSFECKNGTHLNDKCGCQGKLK